VEKNSFPPVKEDTVSDEITMELPVALEIISFPPMMEDMIREETLIVLPVRFNTEPVR